MRTVEQSSNTQNIHTCRDCTRGHKSQV